MSTNESNLNSITSQTSKDKSSKGKKKVIIEDDGSVVGDNAKSWSSRTGDFVRSYIPISYENWTKVPKNFKDDVWKALMGEFELNITPRVARPLMEKCWPQKFRTHKYSLRLLLKKNNYQGVCPKGVDPNSWRKFVEHEKDEKKQRQNQQNAMNRGKLEFSHCLGRQTYAQKQYVLEQNEPGKQILRVDKWIAGHEHADGSVLESAKSKYAEVKAAKDKRKATCTTTTDNYTLEDYDNDEITEVFGEDARGGVRAVGSHVSKKQLVNIGVAVAKAQQFKKANEEASSIRDSISSLNSRFECLQGTVQALCSQLKNGRGNIPLIVDASSSDHASTSVPRPLHLAQNVNKASSDPSQSKGTSTDKPSVILLDKFGKKLANGYIVTGETARVCHFKQVGMGEKKVYVEEVFEPDALLWDAPQGNHNTLAGYVQGGFLIWLECWMNYI